jgi:hypothetical protein
MKTDHYIIYLHNHNQPRWVELDLQCLHTFADRDEVQSRKNLQLVNVSRNVFN